MLGDDELAGLEFANRAIDIAAAVGDDLRVTQALILKGSIGQSGDGMGDVALLEEALRRAELGGYKREEVHALFSIAGIAADVRDIERAVDFTQRARVTAQRYELPQFEHFSVVMEAELLAWKGEWARAEDIASEALGAHSRADIVALRILGSCRTRRGGSDALAYLDRMWQSAQNSGELQHIDPAAATLAEYAWITGVEDPRLIDQLRETLSLTLRRGDIWPSGAFAFWMWKLGLLPEIPGNTSRFYRWIMEGQWQAAADFWRSRGAPYEEGLALWHGDQEAQVRAVEIFETLGADAIASRLRSELAEAGTKVPRGRARSTRSHVAGLTSRQAEVLELVADGLTNPEIADRLFVSHRTAENHVSAILMKLGVSTRDAAVDKARAEGMLGDSTQI
jgi:ATP/maltotriose-dependent transcriptional regulator MalT